MVKALARAFRWRKMLDTGVHATLEELARAKAVSATYISRILRLTLLAPDIVEAILDGRQPAELQLDDLLDGFSVEWDGQRKWLAIDGLQFAWSEETIPPFPHCPEPPRSRRSRKIAWSGCRPPVLDR